MNHLTKLPIGQLLLHPRNMRRVYKQDTLRELADSIRANGGVLIPLIVTPAAEPNTYRVIDGNRRTLAGRILGDDCPLMECKVVTQSQADEMLAMLIANVQREGVDPVSEALHYDSLRQAEGLSVRDISKATGVGEAHIRNRLKLLDLMDEPIRQMWAEGRLPIDLRVVEALLLLPTSDVRVKVATQMEGQSIKAIVSACEALVEKLTAKGKIKRGPGRPRTAGTPMLDIALETAPEPTTKQTVSFDAMRSAAQAMCAECDIRLDALKGKYPEPAFYLITNAATNVCDNCALREIRTMCRTCPGVQLMQNMMQAVAPKELDHARN